MIDVKSFLFRKGMRKADLYRELGMDPKSSLLSSYEKGRSNPSYEVCDKLLRLGMTVEELYGIEYAKMHFKAPEGNVKISDEDLGMAFLRAAEMLGCKKPIKNKEDDNGDGTQEIEAGIAEQHHEQVLRGDGGGENPG